MDVEIRKATLNDLKKVQELNLLLFEKEHEDYDSLLNLNWTFGEEGTKYFTDKIVQNDACVFVSEVDNRIIGYLCGDIRKEVSYRHLPFVAELDNMMVIDEFRSSGIGSKLYEKFIQWCKSKNIGKIRVNVSAENKQGINFYKKNGFKEYSLILETDLK
ncbi:MAG: GNAT family N-acetyltransferase [Nanoarchaeota archaeon]|nr:GNAT family N-acetyltransferase [Nanoarchaeota archaeon]